MSSGLFPDIGSDMNLSVPLVSAGIGVIILFFGRRMFWLCVAAIGFAAGVELAPHLVHEPTPLLALTIALVLGFLGALLALFLQKLAIGVAGFLGGGQLALAIQGAFFAQFAQSGWVIFVIGGIVGALLLLMLFDWALIFLSAAVGAHLLQAAIVLPATGKAILFVALVLTGVLVQAGGLRRSRETKAA
jgi:hypothetical protein